MTDKMKKTAEDMSITLTKISISLFYCFHYPDSSRTLGRQPSYRIPLLSFKETRFLDLAAVWLCPRLPGSGLHCPSLSTPEPHR